MKDGAGSPHDSSGSSITEEIFNTALSNLEFLSDEEPCEGLPEPMGARKDSINAYQCEIDSSSLKI